MIRAIETIYKGYRFRSRLEARWAVFFDSLGVPWEYEKEGYDLGEAGWYLPDFWLPNQECWVEIKPTEMDDAQQARLTTLMRKMSERNPIIVFRGAPSLGWNGTVYCWDTTDSGGGQYEEAIGWAFCEDCQTPTLSMSDNDTRLLRGDRWLYTNPTFEERWRATDDAQSHHHSMGIVDAAISAARAARFEHGESGAPTRARRYGRGSQNERSAQ